MLCVFASKERRQNPYERNYRTPAAGCGSAYACYPGTEALLWLEIIRSSVEKTTFSSYTQMVKKKIAPYFRNTGLTLDGIQAKHIQSFYLHELKTVSPGMVIHYHAIIHSALKYAVKTDMLVQNVADKVDRPKKNSFQPVFLSAEEMQKMFEALRGTKLELPVLVTAFYGFRRGEVLGLKWDAIDFERGTISVIRTVTTITVDGKQTEIEQQSAKTKSSLRTLPLIGSFREYFFQVKEAQELNKQVCGNCYNHEYDGFGFVDELGERMRANYLTSAFPKFLEDHGLRRMRFYDLRHLRQLVAGQRRSTQAHSGVAGSQRLYHHSQYLCPLGLQVQDHLGTGDGDRACSAGGRRL